MTTKAQTSQKPSLAAHTPGPWELHHQSPDLMAGDCDWSLQTESAGAFLLFCHHPDAPAEANARLIAAAPELLRIVQNIIQSHRDCTWLTDSRWFADEARAVIAQATGTLPDRSEPTQSQEAR